MDLVEQLKIELLSSAPAIAAASFLQLTKIVFFCLYQKAVKRYSGKRGVCTAQSVQTGAQILSSRKNGFECDEAKTTKQHHVKKQQPIIIDFKCAINGKSKIEC